jgi:hypothetical protein
MSGARAVMSERELRELTGPLTRRQMRQLAELATRYGYFQQVPGDRESYVSCPLCRAEVHAYLGYGEQLGRGAAGRHTRAQRVAVRIHLIDDCPRTRKEST